MILFDYFSVFYLILVHFLILSSYGKSFDHLFMLLFIVSAREEAL